MARRVDLAAPRREMVGTMKLFAVAYFQFALPQGLWPIVNGGVIPALYCFLWLYFSAAGGGPWSLDAQRGRERKVYP